MICEICKINKADWIVPNFLSCGVTHCQRCWDRWCRSKIEKEWYKSTLRRGVDYDTDEIYIKAFQIWARGEWDDKSVP